MSYYFAFIEPMYIYYPVHQKMSHKNDVNLVGTAEMGIVVGCCDHLRAPTYDKLAEYVYGCSLISRQVDCRALIMNKVIMTCRCVNERRDRLRDVPHL